MFSFCLWYILLENHVPTSLPSTLCEVTLQVILGEIKSRKSRNFAGVKDTSHGLSLFYSTAVKQVNSVLNKAMFVWIIFFLFLSLRSSWYISQHHLYVFFFFLIQNENSYPTIFICPFPPKCEGNLTPTKYRTFVTYWTKALKTKRFHRFLCRHQFVQRDMLVVWKLMSHFHYANIINVHVILLSNNIICD